MKHSETICHTIAFLKQRKNKEYKIQFPVVLDKNTGCILNAKKNNKIGIPEIDQIDS